MTTAPPSPPLAPPTTLIEQYKAYVADLGNVGSRYATANGFYVSTVSALLAVLAFAKPADDQGPFGPVIRIVIPSVALIVCWIWGKTIRYYSALFKTKFDVLREMEREGGFFPLYQRDEEVLRVNARFWLTENEIRVPYVLMWACAGLLVFALILSVIKLFLVFCR